MRKQGQPTALVEDRQIAPEALRSSPSGDRLPHSDDASRRSLAITLSFEILRLGRTLDPDRRSL